MPPSDPRTRLVVNADGFGLSSARTAGVVFAHRHGIVTSTSILGNVEDVASVRAEIAPLPQLGTGVLLSLLGGAPVAKPESVPSLVGEDGRFFARARDVALAWAKAALGPADIEREFDAQVSRLLDYGFALDHLATRDHLGCLPMIAQAMESVARRHAIPGLRMAMEGPGLAWVAQPARGLASAGLGALAWLSRRRLGLRRHGPQSWGTFECGSLDEIRILEILGRLGPGGHELVCRPEIDPGAEVARAGSEVAGLTSPRVIEALTRREIVCCRWADLF